ncbi:transposase, partial [Chryseobacterium sp. MDT2-18]|uniref:transposase n=1 Tax=Chryseobacterium sp. MDT2-18 TaxID=1259136 RepID=UPI002789011D
ESHYLVLYIDATFVHTRRDKSVSKEGYYTILEIKEDGSREVLSIVNHPTEGPPSIQRMIYTTNWIERLNRDYKRVLKMRGAMPSPESILFLMGSVAMEKEYKSYSYPVTAFREIEELKKKQIIEVAV